MLVSDDAALPSKNLTFAWDRPETEESLRIRLAEADPLEWRRLAAWIMREARVSEVWHFLTLRQIADAFPLLAPQLGRNRRLWTYLLRAAHELGRL
jgi:hypothetical protein